MGIMAQETVKYPVGIQTFESIVEGHYAYADKTAIIYDLVGHFRYVFLSRPRRFGKSLLVSTLKSYFQGRKELFTGLQIEAFETEWVQHPVVHLSLASVKEEELDRVRRQIDLRLDEVERELDLPITTGNHGDRFEQIIRRSYAKYGQKVVVLVDEYDAPLLNSLHDETRLTEIRKMMRALYAPLKDLDPILRFVFITDITKFSQLSIFSELNNIANISMLPRYSAICGITEAEMLTTFSEGIDKLASLKNTSRHDIIGRLRTFYDGYCFSENGVAIFNPFSLVTAFATNKIGYYWFGSGTPSYLVEMLKRYNTDITAIDGSVADATQFDAPSEGLNNILPLFYQSGYLTIKDYDEIAETYTLGYPNKEVRIGLMRNFIPAYVTSSPNVNVQVSAWNICKPLLSGDVETSLLTLQSFLKSISYQEGTRNSEGHYTSMLYVIFSLLGLYTSTQVRTSDGRMDILITTADHNYLMELKLDGDAREALAQIDRKGYPLAITNSLPITKIGLNFSTETATVTDWVID